MIAYPSNFFLKTSFTFFLIIYCVLQANSGHPEFAKYPENFIEKTDTKEDCKVSTRNLIKRPLLISGCARSGTKFITIFFKLNGYDVGHEYDGHFGVVAWTMTPNSDMTPWGPGYNNYVFEHIFHQVRNPLKTIASAGNEPPISWLFIKKFIPEIEMDDPKIVKGAKYWYYWNLLAEKKAEWTYRIEDIENQVGKMAALLGIDLNPIILEIIPTNTNTRGYWDVYSWEDLREALDADLFQNIVEMATRYGYDTSD